jgi:Flp pilus assembly CpaE family ATPase
MIFKLKDLVLPSPETNTESEFEGLVGKIKNLVSREVNRIVRVANSPYGIPTIMTGLGVYGATHNAPVEGLVVALLSAASGVISGTVAYKTNKKQEQNKEMVDEV